MFTNPRAEIIHLSLKPGEFLEKHTNPFDMTFYIIDGEALIEAGSEKVPVRANHCVSIESGTQRGVTNTGTGTLRELVFKVF